MRLVEFGRCAGEFACVGGGLSAEGMHDRAAAAPRPGCAFFAHDPVRRSAHRRVSRRTRRARYRETTANFLRFRRFARKTVSKTTANPVACRINARKFPAQTEQGINSTGTGNAIRENRELIRHNRESGAKPRPPDSRQIPSPSRIKN